MLHDINGSDLPQSGEWPGADSRVRLVLAPPMSRQRVLRVMLLGFTLAVLLVLAAAYFGYRGSREIQGNAQDMARDHLVNSDREAALEAQVEAESQSLLRTLGWILGACFVIAVVGSALTVWIINRAFARLAWQADELNRVSWHMVEGHEKISRRFSHEMHDELGQSLTGLKAMVRRATPQDLDSSKGEILSLLDEVMKDVRELSQMLRPVILDDFGLDAGLRWLSERFTQRTGIAVAYESQFTGRAAEQIETQLFRIAQEALTNVARHSAATKVWIRLTLSDGIVKLIVEDNGRGIADAARSAGPSLGMVGMRARVRQVEGDLRVENRSQGGLRVVAEVPHREPEDGVEHVAEQKNSSPVS